MKFILTNASMTMEDEEIEINTIEDLMALIDEKDCDVIVRQKTNRHFLWPQDTPAIVIYDDYVE